MNRYWYRDINWRNSLLLLLGLCLALAAGLFIYEKVNARDPEVIQLSEEGTSEGSRKDVSYASPDKQRTIDDAFTLVDDPEIPVETVTLDTAEGEEASDAPSPNPTDAVAAEVEPNYTGGGFFEPGDTVYYIYSGDVTISVAVAPKDEFYLDGLPASKVKDFSAEAIRLLVRDNEGYLVAYGSVDGKDGQSGAYAITTKGFNGGNYLTMWMVDGDKIVEITGLIYDATEVPDYLKTFALLD